MAYRTTKTVKCPWCPAEVPREEYSDHLQKHYKKVGDKLVGPYTQLDPEE